MPIKKLWKCRFTAVLSSHASIGWLSPLKNTCCKLALIEKTLEGVGGHSGPGKMGNKAQENSIAVHPHASQVISFHMHLNYVSSSNFLYIGALCYGSCGVCMNDLNVST